MYVPRVTRQSYSEIDSFLKCLEQHERDKIPQKLQMFFAREKDEKYKKEISKDIPISEQGLKKETLEIIAILNLQYWCEDEDEKKRLKAIYDKNDEIYKKKIKINENYNKEYQSKEINPKEYAESDNNKLKQVSKIKIWAKIKMLIFKIKNRA